METSSLEAGNIRFVIYPEFRNPNLFLQVDHKILFVGKFGVELRHLT
jgi:hypothetical protein